jgi:DNA replication and repair protein RecF
LFLTKLSLRNYRNYEEIEIETKERVNLFVGPNAQGKTNLLEAIYVAAITKSHRTSKDKELIRWGESASILHAEVQKKYGLYKLDLSITQQGKKAKINGLEQRKLSDFIGTMNVVMFAPEDLEIVKGAPGIRRRFLDMELGQVQPGYVHELQQYYKILVQRNNYLKQPHANSADPALMDIWNEQLARYGVKIMRKRQNFITKLQQWAEQVHAGITNRQEQLRILYQPSFKADSLDDEAVLFEQFMIKLSQLREQEIKRGMTLIGPHRDDMTLLINDKEAQTYGSQGQQRTTALSLKLAEIELIREETGEYPILLLDDVLSELDRNRQTQLIETFQGRIQIFITTTGIETIDMNKLENADIFQVHQGRILQ